MGLLLPASIIRQSPTVWLGLFLRNRFFVMHQFIGDSGGRFSFSFPIFRKNWSFLFEPDLLIDSLGTAPIFESRVLDRLHQRQNQHFFVHHFSFPCPLQLQTMVSRTANSVCFSRLTCKSLISDKVRTINIIGLFFLSTKSSQHLQLTR